MLGLRNVRHTKVGWALTDPPAFAVILHAVTSESINLRESELSPIRANLITSNGARDDARLLPFIAGTAIGHAIGGIGDD